MGSRLPGPAGPDGRRTSCHRRSDNRRGRAGQRFALNLVRLDDGRIFAGGTGDAAVHGGEPPPLSPVDGPVVVARDGYGGSGGCQPRDRSRGRSGPRRRRARDRPFRRAGAPPARNAACQRGRPGPEGRSAGPGPKLRQADPAAPSSPAADSRRSPRSRQLVGTFTRLRHLHVTETGPLLSGRARWPLVSVPDGGQAISGQGSARVTGEAPSPPGCMRRGACPTPQAFVG